MTVETSGDARRAARLGALLGPRHPVAAAAAVVSARDVIVAGRGTGLDADFEIGSIAKGVGAAWITVQEKGRTITWHNGGAGGFRSRLGVDRDADTGAVVLSAAYASVDRHGFALPAEHSGQGRH